MGNQPVVGEGKCNCQLQGQTPELIVLTGGPGAGKTAVLEMIKKILCQHIVILPEAASIVYGGGFWRLESVVAKEAAQTAIYHVQKESEEIVMREGSWAAGLCDRGTIDSLAYWPGSESSFWEMTQTTAKEEYQKYRAVIHLHSPSGQLGYNYQNPLRIESPLQAHEIDRRIRAAWSGHANYESVQSATNFLSKAQAAISLIVKYLPDCCLQNLKGDFLSPTFAL